MALMQIQFYSESLKRRVPMTVILPIEKVTEDKEGFRFKTLYLLHGLKRDHTDWLAYTRIQEWAEQRKLTVVMPYGDNSFYVDLDIPNHAFGEFVGREVVEFTRTIFPLSHRREDTFLAGISMGGFGALRNGLKYHETFGYVAGLSAAIHIFELPVGHPDRHLVFQEDQVMGDLEKSRLTDRNPRVAMQLLQEKVKQDPTVQYPKVYMLCGLQDSLLTANRSFRDFLLESGAEVTYKEADGGHVFDFWNLWLPDMLDWLPLEAHKEGSI